MNILLNQEFVFLNIVLIGVLTSGKDLASVLMEPKSAAALSNVKLSLYLLFMLS